MHAKAVVAGRTIAETDNYEVVEGNVYVCLSALFIVSTTSLLISNSIY